VQRQPELELFPAPGIHAGLSAPAALSAPDEDGAAALIEIAFGKRQRFLDASPSAPRDDDQAALAATVGVVAGGA
jgi:hypothetical protein